MKKNSTPKLFGLALTAALTLATLTACGSPAGTGSSQGAAGNSEPVMQADAGGSVGTVLLSVNPEIEIDYDKAGNVVALTGLNADGQAVLASYTGYEGKACTAVVSELVDEINAGEMCIRDREYRGRLYREMAGGDRAETQIRPLVLWTLAY